MNVQIICSIVSIIAILGLVFIAYTLDAENYKKDRIIDQLCQRIKFVNANERIHIEDNEC